MRLESRIAAFCRLGLELRSLPDSEEEAWSRQAANENPWFTRQSVAMALQGISLLLEERALREWIAPYSPQPAEAKTVGVVMAGNIPLVGFHDLLCVLLSGHRLKAKLSSGD